MASCRQLDGKRSQPLAVGPPYKLLFLGRWHVNKGIDLLLDALDRLEPADWERISEVHIAGGGPLASLVEDRIRGLQAQSRPVRLSGYLDRGQASAALAQADRLLLPSRIESIPVVFSDALAFGIPVISMPVGDLPELLAQGGGWLADQVTGDAFAAAIRESLTDVAGTCVTPPGLRVRFSLDQIAARFAGQVMTR